jgi:hypothetical protein
MERHMLPERGVVGQCDPTDLSLQRFCLPALTGIEASLSETSDIVEAITKRAAMDARELSKRIGGYQPGQTGLLRLLWNNDDRIVLVHPELGSHTVQDEFGFGRAFFSIAEDCNVSG